MEDLSKKVGGNPLESKDSGSFSAPKAPTTPKINNSPAPAAPKMPSNLAPKTPAAPKAPTMGNPYHEEKGGKFTEKMNKLGFGPENNVEKEDELAKNSREESIDFARTNDPIVKIRADFVKDIRNANGNKQLEGEAIVKGLNRIRMHGIHGDDFETLIGKNKNYDDTNEDRLKAQMEYFGINEGDDVLTDDEFRRVYAGKDVEDFIRSRNNSPKLAKAMGLENDD